LNLFGLFSTYKFAQALPHNSDLRRPITKWLVRNLSPSEACRALGLSRASYYRAFHSKEGWLINLSSTDKHLTLYPSLEKLMANASGYHHRRHSSSATLEDPSDGSLASQTEVSDIPDQASDTNHSHASTAADPSTAHTEAIDQQEIPQVSKLFSTEYTL
jgi:hypothetical protein